MIIGQIGVRIDYPTSGIARCAVFRARTIRQDTEPIRVTFIQTLGVFECRCLSPIEMTDRAEEATTKRFALHFTCCFIQLMRGLLLVVRCRAIRTGTILTATLYRLRRGLFEQAAHRSVPLCLLELQNTLSAQRARGGASRGQIAAKCSKCRCAIYNLRVVFLLNCA